MNLENPTNTLTFDLKVISMVCGTKGGNANYPCPYFRPSEEPGFQRTWAHFQEMFQFLPFNFTIEV